jgi:hypothetical protein
VTNEIKKIYQRDGSIDMKKFRIMQAARGNTSLHQKNEQVK